MFHDGRRARALLVTVLLVAAIASGIGINWAVVSAGASPGSSTGFEAPQAPIIHPDAVALNTNSGAVSQDALTCTTTISVAANSVLIVASTQYTNHVLTFAANGVSGAQTFTSLKTSTSSSTLSLRAD